MRFGDDLSGRSARRAAGRGFALIVTLSLMVLLVIMAVGLLTLSSISLRASSGSSAMAAARCNARLSLQLAIGQLQSLAGQDTRITAPRVPDEPSTALDSVVPVTGVWRSWEGSDHEPSGRPKAPDYNSKKAVGDPAQKPAAAGGGRFLGWLTSTGAWEAPDSKIVPDLQSESAVGLVPLVSDGSVKEPKRRVFLKPTLVNASKGAIAWWTSGENAKAHVAPDPQPSNSSLTGWQQRARAHAVPSPKEFGFSSPPETSALTTGTLDLLANDRSAVKGNFHDLTVWSSGLLTNAATGGWKRDLSLMTEKWDELPTTQLPFFTLKPGEDLRFSKAAPPQTTPGAHPANPLLYGWSQYSTDQSQGPFAQIPPIVSWDYLRNACVQYKDLIALDSSSGRTGMPLALQSWWINSGKSYRYEFLDQPRRWPAFSRIYYMFSFASVPDAGTPATASTPAIPAKPDNLKAALVMNPVIVMWNPYNVEITLEAKRSFLVNTVGLDVLPVKFSFTVGSTKYPARSFHEINGNNYNINLFGGLNGESTTLKPGETRVFSVKDNTLNGTTNELYLYPGYHTNGGFRYTTIGGLDPKKPPAEVSAPKDSAFKVDLTFDALIDYGGKGYGSALDFGYLTKNGSAADNNFSRRSSRQYMMFSKAVAEALWPPIAAGDLPECKLSDVQDTGKDKLFVTGVVGFRTANDSMVPSIGCVQASPLTYYTDLSNVSSLVDPGGGGVGAGTQHPANSSYDIQFIKGGDISALPNVEPATNRGYIVSGLDASSGLTNCVVAEIPTRPVQSLCDLQHFDLRNCNPVPPFQFNILGNSQASPLLPPEAVVRPDATVTVEHIMQHDDAYCLNHAFFDDWFVSSIAPDLTAWTNQTKRGLEKVYKDFLDFSKDSTTGAALADTMLRPTPEAMSPDSAKAYDRDVKPADSYRHIASKLTVEGMFNVNSVSVKAWKALLGHALGQRQPYLTASGVALAPGRDHVVSRLSVSGAGAAGIDPPPAGASTDALEFAGHRALTDAQIEALAQEIVTQIRRRGPFLSLAEFINRRLTTSEKDLALGGAVEGALAALAKRGPSDPANPFGKLQGNSRQITLAMVNSLPAVADAKYLFPEAAVGSSANGVPGWLRQGDILRPLAPVLSVRDDTFVIRSYGDARDAQGTITARAWCEAVVRRVAGFIDPSDAETDIPAVGTDSGDDRFLQSEINARFGRSFRMLSFRWLAPGEI